MTFERFPNRRRPSVCRGVSGIALAVLGSVTVQFIVPTTANAAGYGVGAESVPSIGRANAGAGAATGDASIASSNPAGMSRLEGWSLTNGAILVYPEIDLSLGASTLFDGSALPGTNGGNAGTPVLVPNLHLVKAFDVDWSVGLSVTTQYGLVTDYHPGFVGRYSFINANLFSVNVNPSVAWQVTDRVSIGGGANFAYGRQKLRQAIDFGSLCASALGAGTCSAGFGLVPGESDGLGRARLDDWATGFNLGMLVAVTPDTDIGLAYRSKLTFDATGHSRFDVPGNAAAFLSAAGISAVFENSDSASRFQFPASASLSLSHRLNDRLTLSGDVTWTQWSTVEELRLTRDNPAAPDNVTVTDYTDTFRAALGVDYKLGDATELRAGLAFEQTPVQDALREPAVPDSDRFIFGLGASRRITDRVVLDVGYQFHLLDEGELAHTSVTGSTARGTYDITAHIVGVGLRVGF